MPIAECIVRGSINVDEYFYVDTIVRPGQTISSKGHQVRIGGKGANQAVAIAKAGGVVRFYGTIGKDGLWIKEKMASLDINVSGIIVSEESTGRAIIQLSCDADTPVLFPGANYSDLHEKTFRLEPEGSFPISSHLLLQNEIDIRSTKYALKNSKNSVVIFNPSPLPEAHTVIDFPWHRISWLIVNEEEAKGLYHLVAGHVHKTSSSVSTREMVFLLSSLPAFKSANIICTLGGEGAMAFIPAFNRPQTEHAAPSFLHIPAMKLLEGPRDTTGAGDCFTGYFVQSLMTFGIFAKVGSEIQEHDIARILKICVYAAGMCVEKPGTIDSIPTRAEVDARILRDL